ncbi:unnamed protein product [Rotaria socialis]|uniref:Uncharacterized protein n=1 Tax=Rotaria socialis TaxID=392032 RepID=A0A821AIJ6_9BILA|nr:unnamed protein product [Rotaria socialis]CAF3465717.1 unnamed protein product [Rotaria socialis]CAF4211810.1 unnamed protein product [Rotaria socialis]CAF4572848.1 unnamed protein product [Rotaria socialis]
MGREKIRKLNDVHDIPTITKWSTRTKAIVGGSIATAVVAVIIVAVVPPVVLLSQKQASTVTSTQASTVISIYWCLDTLTSDSSNVYIGTLMNGATYFSTTSSQPFVAYGQGLSLTSSSSQYMTIATPFVDLTYKSFTIETWIFSSAAYSGDSGIFGQCECSSCSNQCLYLLVRGTSLYAGFTLNDISGSSTLAANLWYHVAFVYNYDTKQQILYLNGVQDAIKSSASPYQGVNGSINIGSTLVFTIRNYFNGYIDNVKLTTRAKTANEILTAATLAGYYSFDSPSPYNDNGPNGANGTQNGAVIVSGYVNQAIRFTGSSSYFYAYGFFQVGYAVYASKPFSVALWINPASMTSSTIVQFSWSLTSSRCHNLMGLWSNTGINGQIVVQGWAWPIIIGPFISTGTWTHVSVTYSFTNGLTLYVNGTLFGSTGSVAFSNSGYITYLQLGYMYSCTSNSITNNGYQGSVDEVYIYSREITQAEVSALASV